MEYKIFVCSSSGIDLVSHSNTISSIPINLSPSNIESYKENVDLKSDYYYVRRLFDKKIDTKVEKQSTNSINEIINKYKNKEMDIYILLSGYYDDIDSQALSVDNVYAFNYNVYGYTLLSMALALDEALKNREENPFIKLHSRLNNSKAVYLLPKKELIFRLNKNDLEIDIKKNLSNEAFIIEDGDFIKKDDIDDIIKYIEYINASEDNYEIVMEYIDSTSLYLNYFENLILELRPYLKKIKKIQIAPSFSSLLNKYSFGITFIKLEESK